MYLSLQAHNLKVCSSHNDFLFWFYSYFRRPTILHPNIPHEFLEVRRLKKQITCSNVPRNPAQIHRILRTAMEHCIRVFC
jgi:hypothetical protein